MTEPYQVLWLLDCAKSIRVGDFLEVQYRLCINLLTVQRVCVRVCVCVCVRELRIIPWSPLERPNDMSLLTLDTGAKTAQAPRQPHSTHVLPALWALNKEGQRQRQRSDMYPLESLSNLQICSIHKPVSLPVLSHIHNSWIHYLNKGVYSIYRSNNIALFALYTLETLSVFLVITSHENYIENKTAVFKAFHLFLPAAFDHSFSCMHTI